MLKEKMYVDTQFSITHSHCGPDVIKWCPGKILRMTLAN